MDIFVCPRGHDSTEPDYCSECGARLTGAGMTEAPRRQEAAAQAGAEHCPDCGTPRENSGVVFCEICGYNFVSGAHGGLEMLSGFPEPPVPPPAPPPPAQAPPATPDLVPAPVAEAIAAEWSVCVSVETAAHQAGSPEPPADVPPQVYALNQPISLIGRRSEARGVFPEIALGQDDAVSHRHALLQVSPAGALLLRDIGSSNGTRVNGVEIQQLVDVPLKDGDEVMLGHWTRLKVQAGAPA